MNKKPESKLPTYEEAIQEILATVDGPVSIDAFSEQLLQARPSSAKNPRNAAFAKIREQEGWKLVYLDSKYILPVRMAFNGARYRIRLTRENIDHGVLSITDAFRYYFPKKFQIENIVLIDSRGNPIPSQLKMPPHTSPVSLDRRVEYQEPVIILKEWFHSNKFYVKDHILVTIKDWERGIFQLERERYSDRNEKLLDERNRIIADIFFEILESAQSEMIYTHKALPTVYARMPEKEGYPPDQWTKIIEDNPRMETSGWTIHYADSGFSLLEKMLMMSMGESLVTKDQEFTKEEAKQIYLFRAEITRKPSIWREVEIQGKQTLEELDNILRDVFHHDPVDHLSGFWKKIARIGRSKTRYREVEVATVNPFEYGEGSDTKIAALKLQVGDKMKYVYDFGDWIEHTLELRAIHNADKGIKYPKEVARNTPKYELCVECQQKGKENIATWICYSCSDEQRDVILCEGCLMEHEDHYTDELLY